jgi:hypothetical protein
MGRRCHLRPMRCRAEGRADIWLLARVPQPSGGSGLCRNLVLCQGAGCIGILRPNTGALSGFLPMGFSFKRRRRILSRGSRVMIGSSESKKFGRPDRANARGTAFNPRSTIRPAGWAIVMAEWIPSSYPSALKDCIKNADEVIDPRLHDQRQLRSSTFPLPLPRLRRAYALKIGAECLKRWRIACHLHHSYSRCGPSRRDAHVTGHRVIPF